MERYVIHVTKECNMNCRYCYEQDKHSGRTSWDHCKGFLDNLLDHTSRFDLEFLGGEPLLNLTLIKQIIDYLDSLDIHVRYYLTTNGTIMNDEVINLVNRKDLHLGISMDGTKFANSMRVFKDGTNSFDVVTKNITRLLDKRRSNRLFIHIVTHPYNIGYLTDSVDYLYNLGVRSIDPGIVESTMRIDREFSSEFIKQHNIISDRILANKYPGLIMTTLHYPLPPERDRIYIRNSNGVILGESYGNEKNFKDVDHYVSKSVDEVYDLIRFCKQSAYFNHQMKINKNR